MDDPHIVIGHHPDLGIVAANRHNTPVIDHVLRRVGFERAVCDVMPRLSSLERVAQAYRG